MKKPVKIIIEVVLLAAIVFLVYKIYSSIMQPVNFEKQRAYRESIAIQRLKDIRTLQVAYRSVNGKFTSTVDSLKLFYEELYKMYLAGDKNLVFTIENKIPVKDTLFNGREDFCIDSLKFIPFCGEPVEMNAAVKMVSGVPVPLFEAKMPYKLLLKGLDNQLRINLDDERRTQNKYEGLQVGSINAPNNNAGNWE